MVSLLLPFTATVSYIAGSSTIAQLNEDGSITGGTLTVTGRALVEGSLTVGAGATLNAGGASSIGGSLSVMGETLAMSAATR